MAKNALAMEIRRRGDEVEEGHERGWGFGFAGAGGRCRGNGVGAISCPKLRKNCPFL